jgi:general secretion pathway protein G
VTLLEIMVVVAIIGMIAGLVGLVVLDNLQKAKGEIARTQISTFVQALQLFYLDNDFYPSTEQGLQALVAQPTTGQVPKKYPENGYMEAIPLDPWGNEYVHISPAPDAPFLIMSFGRDGLQGGDGHDADITNRDVAKTAANQ